MGHLSEFQKEFYKENGFVLLDNIFTPQELDECDKAYDDLFALKQAQHSDLEATWAGNWQVAILQPEKYRKQSVLSIQNLQCHSAVFTKMLTNDNLLDAVSDAVGSDNILLHHTKAHIKPPQTGAPFPTHQDYHYFPFQKDSVVAVFIHLDDSDPENGGLAVFPGSHLLGPQENMSNVKSHHYVDQEKFPLEKAQPVKARRGQVLIFSYLLVHGSYPNVSSRNRRMLLMQFMAAEDMPLTQLHLSPCHGMVLRGSNPNRNADIHRRHEAV